MAEQHPSVARSGALVQGRIAFNGRLSRTERNVRDRSGAGARIARELDPPVMAADLTIAVDPKGSAR